MKTSACAKSVLTDNGAEVIKYDLYADQFDPVLTAEELRRGYSFDKSVQQAMENVGWADALVFVHPDWWGQLPALLKGWIDRVFREGIAFEYTGDEFLTKQHVPLLSGKLGLAFCLTDASPTPRHSLQSIWEESIFGFCGISGTCSVLFETHGSTSSERSQWLKDVASTVESLFADKA